MIVVLHLLVMLVPYFDRFILTADDVALVWKEVDVTFPQVIFDYLNYLHVSVCIFLVKIISIPKFKLNAF